MKGYTINYRRMQPGIEEWQSDFIMTNHLVNNIYVIEGVRAGETYDIRVSIYVIEGVRAGET